MNPAHPGSPPPSFPPVSPSATPPDAKARAALAQLRQCADTGALRVAFLALCARYGAVDRLDILASTQGGGRQALCFLRMATEAQETRLMQSLGLGRFGGDIVAVVNLPAPTPAQGKPAAPALGPAAPRAANNSDWMSLPGGDSAPKPRRRASR